MENRTSNKSDKHQDSANLRRNKGSNVGGRNMAGNARDREMGRTDEPLGDLGHKKTWAPPSGQQGISNRPGDQEPAGSEQQGVAPSRRTTEQESEREEVMGRPTNPRPKDQDAKAQNGPRNRGGRPEDAENRTQGRPPLADEDRERPGGDQNRHGDRGGTS